MWKRWNFLRSVTRARLPGKWSVSLPRVSISPHARTHTSLHVLHRGVDRYLRRDLPHRASKRITNTMKCSVCNLLTRCSLLTRDRRGIWKNTGGKTRDEEQRIYDSGNHRGQQRRSKVFIVRVSVVGILFNDGGER